MAASFDSYLKWFDILPRDQPPNFYQLLGLATFEDSQAKIEDAVARRSEFLQALSMGQHVEDAQRILNEVATAHICLVNVAKKQEYDDQLRISADTPLAAESIPLAPVIETEAPSTKTIDNRYQDEKPASSRAVNGWMWIAVAGIVLCSVTFGISYFLSDSKVDQQVAQADNKHNLEDKPFPILDLRSKTIGKTPVVENKPDKKTNPPPTPATDERPATPGSGKPAVSKSPAETSSAAKNTPGKTTPGKKAVFIKSDFEGLLVFPKSPFKEFKKQFVLPQLRISAETKISDLYLRSDAPLDLKLFFDKSWSKLGDRFEIRKSTGDKRKWVISRHVLKDKSTIDVATIWTASYAIYFQWLPAGQLDENTNYLRNGVLKLSISKEHSCWLNFRNTKVIKGFQLPKGKYSVKLKSDELDWLPSPKSLKIELSPFPQGKIKSICAPKLVDKEPALMFFTENKNRSLLWLELSGVVRQKRLMLEAELKLLDSKGHAKPFESGRFEKQIASAERFIGELERAKATPGLGQPLKDRLTGRLNAEKKILESCRAYEGIVPLLANQNIEVKLYYEVEDHRVVVAKTGVPRKKSARGFVNQIAELKDYQLVYDIDLKGLVKKKQVKKVQYDIDLSRAIGGFDRVGYLLELTSKDYGQQVVFVTAKAFTKDAKQIAIPTFESKAQFQQTLQSMNVYSNVEGVTNGTNIATGNIEFWPNNSEAKNAVNIQNASPNVFDFGDERAGNGDYGSMQIHNFAASETIFAFNHWNAGPDADLGIGNNKGKHPDWKFEKNAKTYSKKRLRVYVRAK